MQSYENGASKEQGSLLPLPHIVRALECCAFLAILGPH